MFIVIAFTADWIIPLAIFGAVAATAFLLLDRFAAAKPRAEERLEEISDAKSHRRVSGTSYKAEVVTNVLKKATPGLAKPLQPTNKEEQSKLIARLSHAGFRGEHAPTILLGLKVLGLVVGLFCGGGVALLLYGISKPALIRTVLAGSGLFYLPEMILWFITKRRKEEIFLGLPDALDLMVVCVEAGLGLDQAMRRVSEEMQKSFRVIADEFALCNLQIQMGRGRNEVLHELGVRTGVEDLRSLASILIQADKFGSSIAQALRVQSDSMRVRRAQIAEEKAAKTAVKLIFPLVLFIFPGIFVVLVGPAAITMINELLPKMGGG